MLHHPSVGRPPNLPSSAATTKSSSSSFVEEPEVDEHIDYALAGCCAQDAAATRRANTVRDALEANDVAARTRETRQRIQGQATGGDISTQGYYYNHYPQPQAACHHDHHHHPHHHPHHTSTTSDCHTCNTTTPSYSHQHSGSEESDDDDYYLEDAAIVAIQQDRREAFLCRSHPSPHNNNSNTDSLISPTMKTTFKTTTETLEVWTQAMFEADVKRHENDSSMMGTSSSPHQENHSSLQKVVIVLSPIDTLDGWLTSLAQQYGTTRFIRLICETDSVCLFHGIHYPITTSEDVGWTFLTLSDGHLIDALRVNATDSIQDVSFQCTPWLQQCGVLTPMEGKGSSCLDAPQDLDDDASTHSQRPLFCDRFNCRLQYQYAHVHVSSGEDEKARVSAWRRD